MKNINNYFWACLLLIVLNGPSSAQDLDGPQWSPSIIFELGGNAGFGASINGEVLSPRGVGIRAGVGYMAPTVVYPVQAVAVMGEGHSKLEIAAGITVANEGEGDPWNWDGTITVFSGFVGYRHLSDGGTIFRVGLVYLGWTNNKIPWVGISLGRSF